MWYWVMFQFTGQLDIPVNAKDEKEARTKADDKVQKMSATKFRKELELDCDDITVMKRE